MTATQTLVVPPRHRHRVATDVQLRGRWWKFAALLVITVIVIVPIAGVLYLSTQPALGSTATSFTLENYVKIFSETNVLPWLRNSLTVTLATVIISVAVAAPAGYVLSRGRGKLVSGYSLLLFVIQSLPVVTAVIPLFILFAKMNLVDNLVGLTIIYVGSTMSVAIWMMAAYYDSIPIALEEAAWIDGASLFGGFLRIVLRALDRDLLVPARVERLPRGPRVHPLRHELHALGRPAVVLPAERHQLGPRDGRRGHRDAAARDPLRRAEQVLQRRRHRRIPCGPLSPSCAPRSTG
jgi:ABC-type spermidine/putrescine transport system permease subunit II